MMIKEKLQGWSQVSLKIGKYFSVLPFPPNFYTWLTLTIACFGLFCVTQGHPYGGLMALIIAGLFDIVDGGLARHLGKSSARGAFLDGSLDRFVDFSVIFSYYWLPIQTPFFSVDKWIALAIFVAIMPSFEVAYANHRKAVNDPQEIRIWRILNRGEMYPLMLLVLLLSPAYPKAGGYALVAWVGLAGITTLQTLYLSLKLATVDAEQGA